MTSTRKLVHIFADHYRLAAQLLRTVHEAPWLENALSVDSLAPVDKRKRQTRVASVQPSASGEFRVGHLRKDFMKLGLEIEREVATTFSPCF